jgi:hypothetical protein
MALGRAAKCDPTKHGHHLLRVRRATLRRVKRQAMPDTLLSVPFAALAAIGVQRIRGTKFGSDDELAVRQPAHGDLALPRAPPS